MPRNQPITVLAEAEAWELLASVPVGRLATVIDRQPDIFPVNFVVDGHTVVFRTAEGSKLLQVTVNSRVAFQADGWDATSGWSVVVKGAAAEVEHGDRDSAERLPITAWVPTVKNHFVRIAVDQITGRRFSFGAEPEDWMDYTSE